MQSLNEVEDHGEAPRGHKVANPPCGLAAEVYFSLGPNGRSCPYVPERSTCAGCPRSRLNEHDSSGGGEGPQYLTEGE